MQPAILRDNLDLAEWIAEQKASRSRIGFVPTMGALHEGHLSLVEQAKADADVVLVSIFVNPLQFGPSEDLSRYPKTFEQDCQKLAERKVAAVFAPSVEQFYSSDFSTSIDSSSELTRVLCGASRPGHFSGVMTVVCKLLNLTQADVAFFGKKDYQQLAVVKKMCTDLSLRSEIRSGEIVREADGLAMSSRNVYLKAEEREQACAIFAGLDAARRLWEETKNPDAKVLIEKVIDRIRTTDLQTEYCEVRSQENLLREYRGPIDSPAVILYAGRLGSVRLIDNMELHKAGS